DANHDNSNTYARLYAAGCSSPRAATESRHMAIRLPTVNLRHKPNLPLFCVTGFAVLALLSYGFVAYDLVTALFDDPLMPILVDRDFANYWLAGRLVLSGEHLDLFDHSIYFPHLQALFGSNYQIRSWSYPPHFLLFVWPLGLVDYKVGFVAFMTSTFLLFVFAAAAFRREYAQTSDLRILLLAVISYVLMMFVAAQNGFLTAALLLLGLAFMRAR